LTAKGRYGERGLTNEEGGDLRNVKGGGTGRGERGDKRGRENGGGGKESARAWPVLEDEGGRDLSP